MNVCSIFESVSGEVCGFTQGRVTTFVRLAGCNLRCSYCDTKYAQTVDNAIVMSVEQVMEKVRAFGKKHVLITGGEPLLQWKEVFELTRVLYHEGFWVTIETNGSLPKRGYGVGSWVIDFKLPGSGMFHKMVLDNFLGLGPRDVIKFVVGDRNDFDIAVLVWRGLIDREYGKIDKKPIFAFSPVFGLDPAQLVRWILDEPDLSEVVLSLQIHKYIWPNCGEGKER